MKEIEDCIRRSWGETKRCKYPWFYRWDYDFLGIFEARYNVDVIYSILERQTELLTEFDRHAITCDTNFVRSEWLYRCRFHRLSGFFTVRFKTQADLLKFKMAIWTSLTIVWALLGVRMDCIKLIPRMHQNPQTIHISAGLIFFSSKASMITTNIKVDNESIMSFHCGWMQCLTSWKNHFLKDRTKLK